MTNDTQSEAEFDPMALSALRNNQRQLDRDGIEVGVSRQALDMVIEYIDRTEASRTQTQPASAVMGEVIRAAKAMFYTMNDEGLEWDAVSSDCHQLYMLGAKAAISAATAKPSLVDGEEALKCLMAARELVESIVIIQGMYAHAARQGRSYKAQALIEINDAIAAITKPSPSGTAGEGA